MEIFENATVMGVSVANVPKRKISERGDGQMKKLNLKGITSEAVISIILQIIAVVNMALQMFGFDTLPISNENVTVIISLLFTIVITAWNTWKNRNLTKASQEAQQITDMIKNGEVMVDEIVEVIQGFKDRSTKGNESAEG